MTRLMITSDLHLGHLNICKFRTQFSTPEEHDNIVFENLATSVNKRDSLILLGDVAFTKYWLDKIKSINCAKKLLVCGNHDTEKGIKMRDLVKVYDDVVAMYSRRNYWFSHCPIHPAELRGRLGNIHGHGHQDVIDDPRYFNVCLEHTNYKPISFADLINKETT